MAAFHFNSRLFRSAAVYHRLLKIVTGRPAARDWVGTLREKAKALYQQWTGSKWSSQHIHAVHEQGTVLKHEPSGVYERRVVTYQDAVEGVGEVLDLLEAWIAQAGSTLPATGKGLPVALG